MIYAILMMIVSVRTFVYLQLNFNTNKSDLNDLSIIQQTKTHTHTFFCFNEWKQTKNTFKKLKYLTQQQIIWYKKVYVLGINISIHKNIQQKKTKNQALEMINEAKNHKMINQLKLYNIH